MPLMRTLIISLSLNRILRHRGHFGNVSLTWQLFDNNSALRPGEEFYETYGTVCFMDGERSKPITLRAISDRIPEFNEFYTLKLVNASGIVFHTTISFISGRKELCLINQKETNTGKSITLNHVLIPYTFLVRF